MIKDMAHTEKPSFLGDTRIIDCGENLEQLKKLPDKCIDLDPAPHSDGAFKEFWREFRDKLALIDCPESTQAYQPEVQPFRKQRK